MAKRARVTYKFSESDGVAPISSFPDYIEHQLGETICPDDRGHSDPEDFAWYQAPCEDCADKRFPNWRSTHILQKSTDSCIRKVMRQNGHKLQPSKDAMKTKMYRIEYTVRKNSKYNFDVGDWDGVREFYKEVFSRLRLDKSQLLLKYIENGLKSSYGNSSQWTYAKRLMKSELPQLTWNPSKNWADANRHQWRIRLPKKSKTNGNWAWNGIVLLHEFAHLLAPERSHHDGVFVRTFIDLIKLMESKKLADRLEQMFVDGVNVGWENGAWVGSKRKKAGFTKIQVDVASPIHGLCRFRAPNKFGWSFFPTPSVMLMDEVNLNWHINDARERAEYVSPEGFVNIGIKRTNLSGISVRIGVK